MRRRIHTIRGKEEEVQLKDRSRCGGRGRLVVVLVCWVPLRICNFAFFTKYSSCSEARVSRLEETKRLRTGDREEIDSFWKEMLQQLLLQGLGSEGCDSGG